LNPRRRVNASPVFKTGALNRSATLPFPDASGLAKRAGMRKGQLTPRPPLHVATQAPDRSKRSVKSKFPAFDDE
jgi:hypothetical protein